VPAYIDSHCFVLKKHCGRSPILYSVPSDQLETERVFSVRAFLVV